ncbi:hypothetical protein Fot_06454 [Forsythia ovata]|uniref:Uncharacterized protein n=1 Tax=Forsythia ovata TaxID=205694 RepID=A0ABD1WTP4_9LAMI
MGHQKDITSCEIDVPNFDLGIDSQSNAHCLLIDDGLVLTDEDIMKIDFVVVLKLDRKGTTKVASVDTIVEYVDENTRKRCLNGKSSNANKRLKKDRLQFIQQGHSEIQAYVDHHLAINSISSITLGGPSRSSDDDVKEEECYLL